MNYSPFPHPPATNVKKYSSSFAPANTTSPKLSLKMLSACWSRGHQISVCLTWCRVLPGERANPIRDGAWSGQQTERLPATFQDRTRWSPLHQKAHVPPRFHIQLGTISWSLRLSHRRRPYQLRFTQAISDCPQGTHLAIQVQYDWDDYVASLNRYLE